MPTRLCLHPRCPNPATYRGRCPTHSRTHERITHARKHFYNSGKWKHTRRAVLHEQPICEACDAELATDVDHIVPIEAGGNQWARTNLQALCQSCHSQKTRREQTT